MPTRLRTWGQILSLFKPTSSYWRSQYDIVCTTIMPHWQSPKSLSFAPALEVFLYGIPTYSLELGTWKIKNAKKTLSGEYYGSCGLNEYSCSFFAADNSRQKLFCSQTFWKCDSGCFWIFQLHTYVRNSIRVRPLIFEFPPTHVCSMLRTYKQPWDTMHA